MSKRARIVKSFTLEAPIVAYVKRTQGRRSASERVNELLRRGIQQEELAQLEKEAAEFYAAETADERAETRAFQKAAKKVWRRD
jgi:hypothetical protein